MTWYVPTSLWRSRHGEGRTHGRSSGRSCLRGSLRSYLEAMKLDSKYFDSVRVRPDEARPAAQDAPVCQWKGCKLEGVHRAPRGRGYEGQYYLFCLDHVRQFNASYNYF